MVVGAPEVLLGMVNLNFEEKRMWQKKLSSYAQEGKRILGFLYKKYTKEVSAKAAMDNLRENGEDLLTWVGLMSFEDPVRKGVRQALAAARVAGIKTVLITGDYRETALAVMKSLGIHPGNGEVMEGWELEKMSDTELRRVVDDVSLFARTRPTQKLRIVEALQKQGAVVGMMGDGVNDAPALAAADIGMVVGEATDLAKDAADMVLLDSNFATIVAAIEEGRGIYDNIRKIITFLLEWLFRKY
jgi:P-type Ca2+ transporter type 2C